MRMNRYQGLHLICISITVEKRTRVVGKDAAEAERKDQELELKREELRQKEKMMNITIAGGIVFFILGSGISLYC